MKFGVSVGDAPWTRSLALLRAAERAEFDQIWVADSHILWQEAFSLLGWLIGQSRSDGLEWGTCVTNPVTRSPLVTASAFATLNQITDGRVICGIGRGDSSVRVGGGRPATVATLERAVEAIGRLGTGESVVSDSGDEVAMSWARGGTRVYVAGYGPKVLQLAGRIADGVIFQIADPALIEWGMRFVREGARAAGRDADTIVVHCATATYISDDLAVAREQTRWFPAAVGNHIADVLRHHGQDDLPRALTDYVAGRGEYDYGQHGSRGAGHEKYVPDEIVDRFCVIGSVEQVREKLIALQQVGVDEFNIYSHVDGIEDQIERYGRDVIPSIRAHR